MKTSFDIDRIVLDLLRNSVVKDTISGGIYFQNDRPDNSTKEDIVINTITMTQDFLPQIATSNINIYASDVRRNIKGIEQLKPDHKRLSEITKKVLEVLRVANIDGLLFVPESQTMIQDKTVNQHFSNIRITWNIQID